MENYIGVKEILAKPMTSIEYNNYRGWELPEKGMENDEGYLVEYLNSPNSNHPNHKGYISWSPKAVFDESYFKVESEPKEDYDLQPHQERVVEEAKLLGEKYAKLKDFIGKSDVFKSVDKEEQDRLKAQSLCMKAYLGILLSRINNF